MLTDRRIQCTFYYFNGSSRSWESSAIGIKHRFPRKSKEFEGCNSRPVLIHIETLEELSDNDRQYFVEGFQYCVNPVSGISGVFFNKELGRC